jgi:leader peptidase (prepilin peptidase)/N-methyltransferase
MRYVKLTRNPRRRAQRLLAPGGAALFAVAQPTVDGFGPALLAGFFTTVFLALTFTDLERRLIPNRVVYPSILLAAALSWAWPDRSVAQVFGGGAAALVITSVMYILGRGAFGFGDVKMSTLMGLVVGFPVVFVGIFFGAFAAGAYVLPLVIVRVLHRRDYIAYGPFIAIGAVVALFWGDPIWDWYFNR